MPALGTNSFSLRRTHYDLGNYAQLSDTRSTTGSTLKCSMFNKYTRYDASAINIPVGDPSLCDSSVAGVNDDRCELQVFLRFSSSMISTISAERNKSRSGIILDEGAIVGGVTFGTWVLQYLSNKI